MNHSEIQQAINEQLLIINQAAARIAELNQMVAEEETMPDFSDYPENSRHLLEAIWHAPNRTLSKAEIGEAITGNDLEGDAYIKDVKRRANEHMKKRGFLYELKPIRGEGYKLVHRATFVPPLRKSLEKQG